MRDEAQRLRLGPEPSQKPGEIGTAIINVKCSKGAESVLGKVKEVLTIVLNQYAVWPSLAEWKRTLPMWFVHACRAEITKEEADREQKQSRSLSPQARARYESTIGWSLEDWLYWFEPQNRHWFWWNASIEDPTTIRLEIEISEWPFPWDDLRWLLRCAGAHDVSLVK